MSDDYEPSSTGAPRNTRPMDAPNFEDEDEELVLPSNARKGKNKSKSGNAIVQKLFHVSQIKTLGFYQSLFSEFLGTMLLTVICSGTGLPVSSKPALDVNGALASGLIVATIIVGFGHVSGAHINPAVTISFLVATEIDFLRAIGYIVVQLLGAMCGSTLVRSITPLNTRASLGMTAITEGVSLTQAFAVEFLITFILCYTVHAICDRKRLDIGGSKALAVGFAVTIGCLFGGPYTGASMNPARSFGPAFVAGNWRNHWVYWYGPIAGGIVAALVYTRILKKKAVPAPPPSRPVPINAPED